MKTMTIRISALKLMDASPTDVLAMFQGPLEVLFEDGKLIKMGGTELAINRYAWELLKHHPKPYISSRYHIGNYTDTTKTFTSAAFRKLLSAVMNDIFDIEMASLNDNTESKRDQNNRDEYIFSVQDRVWEEIMQINNRVFNDVLVHYMPYHIDGGLDPLLEIVRHPEMRKIDEENVATSESVHRRNIVDKIYKEKTNLIKSHPDFNQNPVAIMLKSGTIKGPQLMQCLGPRGVLTDIDGSIFTEPIKTGYLKGMNRAYDVLVESRTAAMSLNNQSSPLQFTEYLSRRMQFIGMEVENLHFGDCGTDQYMVFQVQANRPGYVMTDLELLQGMYYLNEETNHLEMITKASTHLYGKTIKLRTIMGCKHKDPKGVCSTCLGAISRNIPRYRNIGHYATVSLMEIISQLVLSTKHHVASAAASSLILSDYNKRYLKLMKDGLALGLSDNMFKHYRSVKLVLPEVCITGMADLIEIKDVSLLSPKRTSNFSRILLATVDNSGKKDEEVLDVAGLDDGGFLSAYMLNHMKEYGWITNNANGTIEIELINIDPEASVIEVTAKQSDMFRYAKTIEKLIKSSVSDIRKRATATTPESFLMELSDRVNLKLGINLSILQVIAYSMLATNIEGKDYSLPKPWTTRGVGTMDHLLWGRSLSGALSYEKHLYTLTTPNSFRYTNRTDSPMDQFFTPEQMHLPYLKYRRVR